MNDLKHIGTSTKQSTKIDSEKLGEFGSQNQIVVESILEDGNRDSAEKFNDNSIRKFEARALVSKNTPDFYNLNGDFNQDDGSSYVKVSSDVDRLKLNTPDGQLDIGINRNKEISNAIMHIETDSALSARFAILKALGGFLDRMSYLSKTPMHISLVVILDQANLLQHIYYISPPRIVNLTPGGEHLFDEMLPIYAIYREAMNSSSPYYRVLCFNKIIEGLLGYLRFNIQKQAKLLKIQLRYPSESVPYHKDLPKHLHSYIDMPIKKFYDEYLNMQYRNAMAHFKLRQKHALHVGSPNDASAFADVAFVSDLCARILIQNHEAALNTVYGAKSGGIPA